MSVFQVVYDDATGDLVALVKRDEAVIFPLGTQQFGPSPQGRQFFQSANIQNALNALQIEAVHDAITGSPLLSSEQKAEALATFNTLLPGDRFQFVPQSVAREVGLLGNAPLADVGNALGLVIQRFVDP